MHDNGLSSKTPGNYEPALTNDTHMFLMDNMRFILWGPVCFIGISCELSSHV